MKTTHTPGPWHVIADPAWKGKHPLHDARFVANCDQSKTEIIGDACDGSKRWQFEDRFCSIICTMPDSEHQKQDALLIAAAPELLEALETLLDCSPCQNGCDPSDMTCASNLARAAIAKAKGQL